MTIKRKRLDTLNNLEEIETSPQDTVDTAGFSAAISGTNVGKSCQFSDTSIMQANSGLLIGLMGFTVNAGAGIGRVISVESFNAWVNPDHAFTGESPDTRVTATPSPSTVTGTVVYEFTTTGPTPSRILTLGGTLSFGDGANGNVNVAISTDNISFTTVFSQAQGTGISNWSFTSGGGGNTYVFVRVIGFLNNFDLGSGSITITNLSESATTSDTVTVRVISSSVQDSTTGTILISDTVLSENTSASIFSNDIVLSNPGEFINLVSVSNTGLPVPIDASAIISIKEENP